MTNLKIGLLSFYKELDQQEIKLKEEYDKMVSFPLTSLSALLAGAYFLIDKASKLNLVGLQYATFVGLLITFFTFWFISAISFIDFMYGFKGKRRYLVLPKAAELSKYHHDLLEHLQKNEGESEIETELESVFQQHIMHLHIEHATHNAILNDQRQQLYYRFKTYLVSSFFVLFFITFISVLKIMFK